MSRDSMDVVRSSLEALASGGLDAMAEYWDPEIDWRAIEGAPDDVGEILGATAMRRYLQEWVDMFDDITNVPGEVRDVGDGRVAAEQHVTARAKISGALTDLDYAVLYTVRDGKIVRGREYKTLEEALDAAGQSS